MKQTIVIDKSMSLSQGKIISQASHASLEAALNADEKVRKEWREKGAKKIVLDLGSDSFDDLRDQAMNEDLPFFLVRDAGKTETEPGTTTALGIGPAEETLVDNVTGNLETV